MSEAGEAIPGLVLCTVGGVYEVELADGRQVEASLRGRLKLEQRTGDRVVAGDRVTMERQPDGAWTIEAVAPRRRELARRDPRHRGRRAKVLAANLDQLVAVFAASRPEPKTRMLDRFLVLAESNDLPAVVVANKVDLSGVEEARAIFGGYEAAGYPVIYTSVPAGRGLDELRACLEGRISTLAGPSGVGKSSLLNALWPGLGLRVGEVSAAVGKGRHTTVSARLLPMGGGGGYVADTPGLREIGVWGLEPAELASYFPEMRPFLGGCRFAGSCTHVHEPDCAVIDAVEGGSIPRERYESYLALRVEMEQR